MAASSERISAPCASSETIVPRAMYDYLKIKDNKQPEPPQLAPPIPTTPKPVV